MAAPVTPRTELRDLIVGISWQKRAAEAMREVLTRKVIDFSLEWVRTMDPLTDHLVKLEDKAVNVLFETDATRNGAYSELVGGLAMQYLEKGGELQSLADGLYGEAASEAKTRYMELTFSMWETLRSAFQQVPSASEE